MKHDRRCLDTLLCMLGNCIQPLPPGSLHISYVGIEWSIRAWTGSIRVIYYAPQIYQINKQIDARVILKTCCAVIGLSKWIRFIVNVAPLGCTWSCPWWSFWCCLYRGWRLLRLAKCLQITLSGKGIKSHKLSLARVYLHPALHWFYDIILTFCDFIFQLAFSGAFGVQPC